MAHIKVDCKIEWWCMVGCLFC